MCYNCYFLNVGNVWSKNQLQQMEDYSLKNKFKNDPKPDLEIEESYKKHLKELGLWEDDTYNNDGSEYISKS